MKVTVDGIDVDVPDGATVLEAARMADRWVPTLCFDERMVPFGACRVCMVGLAGSDGPIAACTTRAPTAWRCTPPTPPRGGWPPPRWSW